MCEQPLITIVDEQDEVIEYKDRLSLNYEKDIYRVSALWVIDFDGNILLAQRSLSKKHHPGLFGPAVAGTVEQGETYRGNIIKEAEEELGLTNLDIIELDKEISKSKYTHFTTWFFTQIHKDTEFILEDNEVAIVRWFSPSELKELMSNQPELFLESLIKKYEYINNLVRSVEM